MWRPLFTATVLAVFNLFAAAQSPVTVQYLRVDSASSLPSLQTNFIHFDSAQRYVTALPQWLQRQGYAAASIDSLEIGDSLLIAHLYLGTQYRWLRLTVLPKDGALVQGSGWRAPAPGALLSWPEWQRGAERIAQRLESTGFPFSKVLLDSLSLLNDEVSATLSVDSGPPYRIDSVRNLGTASVSSRFLQQYVRILPGSPYNRQRIEAAAGRLQRLPYLQAESPPTLTYGPTGSILNLYLAPRRNNAVSLLAGLLPNPAAEATGGKRLQFTIDANLLLRNAFGNGETIGLVAQKLQPESGRLRLEYARPYIFRSGWNAELLFSMFRKDSSFTNIEARVGATVELAAGSEGGFFLERQGSIVSIVNGPQVIATRRLPAEADFSSTSLGAVYRHLFSANAPVQRRGWEGRGTLSAGLRRLKKSNTVLALKDPADPTFSFASLYDTVALRNTVLRASALVARHIPLGRQSLLRGAVQAGYLQSGRLYRNELFQIGGIRLLRGFDEESQYVSQYAIATAEWRYPLSEESYFFAFSDGGWARHSPILAHTYLSGGAGIYLRTRAGLLQLALASGWRNDARFDLRATKLHLGFVNTF